MTAASLRYVVRVERKDSLDGERAFGIYRSFKRADADARAWNHMRGLRAHVVPLSRDAYPTEPDNGR